MTTAQATDLGATPRSRSGLVFVLALIFLACLPDAMLPPALRPLMVERFGATEPQAHWFMSVNLVGALLAVPILSRLRRLVAPATLVAIGAAANAALLSMLVIAPSLRVALGLRFFEGVADMVVLAALLDLAAKGGGLRTQGRRLGVASTVLMFGLAGGAVMGGQVGGAPNTVLLLGGAFCAVLALGALVAAPLLRRSIVTCPVVEHDPTLRAPGPPLWTVALMMGSDRMLAGLLTSTIPLLLASRFGWSTERIGGMLALPLLVMAVGAFPAGIVADRLGPLYTRSSAALVYALALAVVPIVPSMPGPLAGSASDVVLLAVMLIVGLSAAALMPSAMTLAARTGRGAVAMSACQAAGNVGYLIGIAGAGWLLGALGGDEPSRGAYTMVIQLFALAHVIVTGVTMLEGASTRAQGFSRS